MPRNIHPTPFIIHPEDDLVQKHPELKRLSFSLSQKYADHQVVNENDLKAMGSSLWDMLSQSTQTDFDAAHFQAGAAILPVVIVNSIPDIQSLPWETLHHPSLGFIGKHPGFTLSRRINSPHEHAIQLEKGPLRILLFTSLPENVDLEKSRLNVEEEQAQVQEALLPWISKGLVQLEIPDDGRFATLKELLKRIQPHILYLSGHGNFHYEPHTGESAYGEFFFENEAGDSDPVRDHEIAEALIGTQVQAVILSACQSGKAASDALTNGLARRISDQGIAHVIGMRESIYDRAGIQFARALCNELAGRERIDTALQAARIAIQTPFKDIEKREVGKLESSELSYGQWCLPMLLSSHPETPLVDWDFTPEIHEEKIANRTLSSIPMPARFVGRRAELRKYKNNLINGKLHQLLITGPGGQGKTTLAGKLALDMQARDYQVFDWSARADNSWKQFEFKMELALSEERVKKYDYFKPRLENDKERAEFLLDLLVEQFHQRVILFLDNLETLLDDETRQIKDAVVKAWIDVACSNADVILFLTSRWELPDWKSDHLSLARSSYGDFLQMAQGMALRKQLSKSLFEQPGRIRRVYEVLGGNSRGLEFFAGATREMQDSADEESFLEALANTKQELQANMAIEAIYTKLPDDAKKLLGRLPAFQGPVPIEGVIKLGLDLPDPAGLLARILSVSLLDVSYEPHWDVTQYQCSPLVSDWMADQNLIDTDPAWLNTAAEYQLYLYRNERTTLMQAIATHHALRRAKRDEEADRLTLVDIVRPLTMAGFYATLLSDWLPPILNSRDLPTRAAALNEKGKLFLHLGAFKDALPFLEESLAICQQTGDQAGEGTTLNNISQVFKAQGDYETALTYLKRSLSIRQQTGEKAGEGTTLNNISQIYSARGDYETALTYLKQSLAIRQQIGDQAGEGTTLNNISQIYDVRGDYETALIYLKQALAICQQIGEKAGEGMTLNNISGIYAAQGDYETALTYLKQSLAISQQIGDKKVEGTTLNNISQVFKAQGDYETALTYLKQSLAISQQIGDQAGEGATLNNISQIYDARGDYETALTYLKQALSIVQQIGDKKVEGVTLNGISQVFKAQGDYETALIYLKQSLAISQQIGDKKVEGTTLNNIGNIYHPRGDYETALTYLKQSLAIRQQVGDQGGEGTTLNNISQVFKAQGDYETALTYLKQSLAICQQIGDKAGLCATLFNMGHIHLQNNQVQEAVSAWVTVYIIAKQMKLAQALDALSNLAPTLGLPEGLDGWEKLAEQMQS